MSSRRNGHQAQHPHLDEGIRQRVLHAITRTNHNLRFAPVLHPTVATEVEAMVIAALARISPGA